MIVNLTILPLTFISSIWFPTDGTAGVADRHREGVSGPAARRWPAVRVRPAHDGSGLNGADIGALAIWCVVGIALMVRFLRAPQGDLT